MVDFNDEGNIICFWIDSKGSDREARWSEKSLCYAKLTRGGTLLSPPKKVISLNDEESMNPPSIVSYVFDSNHNLFFFWMNKTSTGEYIDSYLIKILSDGTFSAQKKMMDYNNLLVPPTAMLDIGADGKIYFIGCGKTDTNPEGIPSYRDFYDYYILDANLNKIYSKTGTTFYAEGHQWITTQICGSKIKDGTFHVIVESSFENQILELYEIKYYGDSSTGPAFSRLSDLDGSESKQPKLYQYNNELFLLWSDNKHSQNTLNNQEIYMKTTGELSFTNITYPGEQTKNTNTNDTSSKPEKDNGAENKTPGFELILVVCSIAAVLFWKRKII